MIKLVIFMKHIFLLNRFSLKKNLDKYKSVIESVAKELELDYVIEVNSQEVSAEDILEKYRDGTNIIYAVGGDGIMNRVVNAMIGTKNKVACIPAGTGNDFNRSVGEFFQPGDNLVDVIRCNDRYFVNVACFGIDADIANDNAIMHNILIPKGIQYKMGILKHLAKCKIRDFKLQWNGKIIKKRLAIVTVCNASYYGGGFHVNRSGRCDDGLLDAYIVSATNRRQLLTYLMKMLKGEHEEVRKIVEHVRTSKFTLTTNEKIGGNLDGEMYEGSSFEMEVLPKAMTFYLNKPLIDKIGTKLEK